MMNGDIDLFTAYILIDKSKHNKLELFPMYSFAISVFYQNESGTQINSLAQLNGKRIGVILNTPHKEDYDKYNIKTMSAKNVGDMIALLKLSRIDAFEAPLLTGLAHVRKHFKLDAVDFFHFQIIDSGPCVLRTHPRFQELKDKTELGLKRLISSGKYIELLEEFWGKDNIPVQILPKALKKYGQTKIQTEKIKIAPSLQQKMMGP